MREESKGIYKLKTENANFPEGQIEYDFNNIKGWAAMKINMFLQKKGHVVVSPITDSVYNACVFALASKQDFEAIFSLDYSDFMSIFYITMGFFGGGLDVESVNSTQADNT